MIHDTAHEEKQNEAIRALAGAIASVAAQIGLNAAVRDAHRAVAILSADEAEGPTSPPEPQAPKAELHVTPPATVAPVAADDRTALLAITRTGDA